ncbi:MAG TPA: AI-2E family transporter [Acidobacteriaceae bacterium]|nr:AI-2E family transporter [Acidobacteriaceae bacterium]
MNSTNTSREISHLLYVIVAVVVIAVLYLAKTVILPLALAVLFTFLLAPLVTFLERIRLPRFLAIACVILAAGAILSSIGLTAARQLLQVADELPGYASNIHEKVELLHPSKMTSYARAQRELDRLSEQIGFLDLDATADQHRDSRELGASPDRPVSVREVGKNNGRLDALNGILGVMLSILLVVVFTFFMLLEREDLRNRLIRLTGRGHLNLMTQAMDDASHRVSRYLSLQLLVNTCYGAIIFGALHWIGLPHALLWGALAGLLRFIPYIGAPIAALLPTLLSLAVFNGWTHTLLIMALFFCMEVLTANFIEPHIYGKHIGLSSLAILVAAIFWSLIWGPVGLILSVPLTVCLVVVGSHVPSMEFLAVLLGDQPVISPEAHYYQRLLANDEREASQVLEEYLNETSLPDLYASLLIPALSLAEQDRHRKALDDATVNFINRTTKDLVEELGLSKEERKSITAAIEASAIESPRSATDGTPASAAIPAKKIACIPVRDEADEIIAIMLTQLLERAGYSATAIPLGGLDTMLAEMAKTKPDVVCLSALPPYTMSHARRVYRRLRGQNADLKIIIGLWNYTDDLVKAASEISGGELEQASTTLAQAILQVSLIAPATLATDEKHLGFLGSMVLLTVKEPDIAALDDA